MRTRVAAALAFTTSAAVLVLEILAGRLLAPYVGVSLETFTAIVGTVLAGIASGSALGGWSADRVEPRLLIGPFVFLGGVLALVSLVIVSVLGPSVAGGGPGALVLLTATAFFLPAAVLSAVTPMAAKARLGSLEETGTVVGGLSAAATTGALVGTFATGFVLVAALPTRPIVIGLGAALTAGGVVLWWRWGAGRPGATLGAAAVLAASGALALPGPCQQETAYFCVTVRVDPSHASGRVLLLDTLRHSYVDLDDPTHLEFRYTRVMADVLDATAPPGAPVDVLHIGGGGFTFPRYVAATRPESTNVVLELDPELVRIAEEELSLERGPGLSVRVGDARTALAGERTDSYQLVVGDAFGGLAVPWHLATTEVVEEVARVLRPGGRYVLNVIDGGPYRFVRAEAATLAAVFDHVAVVVPPPGQRGPGPVNHVLVGSDAPLGLGGRVGPGDGEVLAGAAVDGFVDGARPLVDDFAPVDQLITRR
ncbi:MAG: fused MFS/spermidine synthase [Acidimicrobiales bacterium]